MRVLVLAGCLIIVCVLLIAVSLNALDNIVNARANVERERTAQVQAVQEGKTERFEAFLATLAALTRDDSTLILAVGVLIGLNAYVWRKGLGGNA